MRSKAKKKTAKKAATLTATQVRQRQTAYAIDRAFNALQTIAETAQLWTQDRNRLYVAEQRRADVEQSTHASCSGCAMSFRATTPTEIRKVAWNEGHCQQERIYAVSGHAQHLAHNVTECLLQGAKPKPARAFDGGSTSNRFCAGCTQPSATPIADGWLPDARGFTMCRACQARHALVEKPQ